MKSAITKYLLISSAICVIVSTGAFAENAQNSDKKLSGIHRSIDSSEDVVGNAVKGTGNVIRSTKETVHDVGTTIGDTFTDADDAD